MSRTNSWIDKDLQERKDVADLIDDDAIEIRQHRYPEYDKEEENIFKAQTPKRELKFVRNIRGRIDRRDRIYTPKPGEVSKSTDHLFIATLYHSDVKINDVLIANGNWYNVKFLNEVGQSFTEAELEVST